MGILFVLVDEIKLGTIGDILSFFWDTNAKPEGRGWTASLKHVPLKAFVRRHY